jgi:hypothetical protein
MLVRFAVFLVVLTLSGCANFKAVSAFATETTKMTSVVKDEFGQLQDHCTQQAAIVAATNNIRDGSPFEDCERYRKAEGELASVTVAVLDAYAKALAGLADDKSFDLSSEIKTISGKLQGLKDSGGTALINAEELGAVTKVVDLLVDIWASAKREEAVRKLAAESPDLAVIGGILKSFFVETANAPAGRAKAPYTNLVLISSKSLTFTESKLSGPALHNAEPIRTFELLKDLNGRREFLALRGARFDAASPYFPASTQTAKPLVQVQIAAAIDAWLSALDKFSTDALKRDPRELYDRLKVLREKAVAARDAVSGT